MKSGKHVLWPRHSSPAALSSFAASLTTWVQHMPAGPAIGALFRSVPMPAGAEGAVPILRPPAESRTALTNLIAGAPGDAALYRLRAQEAEAGARFRRGRGGLEDYAGNATDRYGARIELADFYHRRVQPRDEIAALTAAAAEKDDPLQAATDQRGWKAFERMAAVVDQEALPELVAEPVFRAWVARYPKEPEAWRKLIDYLVGPSSVRCCRN